MRMHFWFAAALLLLTCLGAAAQSEKPAPGTLTVEAILDLSKAGISEDIIVAKIKGNAKAFDLNADEIRELKRSGVSDVVIKVMLDPSQPYAPPQPLSSPASSSGSTSSTKAPRKVIDPIAEKVPPEPGVYYSADPASGDFQRLEYKTLAAAKQGGKLSKVLSAGLKKQVVIGFIVGQSAKAQLKTDSPTFYIRLMEKAGIEEYLLVKLAPGPNRRELELGTDPAKPVFPAAALKQSQSTEVEPGLFRVTAGPLDPGEYLFYVLGTADEKKGILAKGYEVGVSTRTGTPRRQQ